MPTQTKSVDSKAAFELVFDLLQKIPWIVRDASAALPDIAVMKAHQAEAVNVILWICETGDLAGWSMFERHTRALRPGTRSTRS